MTRHNNKLVTEQHDIEELIEGCRAGKNDARKKLYTLYAKQMLAVCYRYTGDIDNAHDVLHDGFIKIFTNFNYRGECALKTWLSKVMMTQSIDYLRREERIKTILIDNNDWPEIIDEEEIAEKAQNLSIEQLMEMIATLPDGCRTVFNLYIFEEKSHKEIARLLGIKEHSSTSQLHRAKQILWKKIKEMTNEATNRK